MAKTYNKYYQSIGNTPLIYLRSFSNIIDNNLYAKVESRNPSFSVKDRIAYGMITDALKTSKLRDDMEVVEPTSGNTGIALAMVGASLNIKVNIIMPKSMSDERKKIIKAFGANLILTEPDKGMKGAIEKAETLTKESPNKFYMPDQFSNPSNPKIHEITTGPEIESALNGNIDLIFVGVGTGGTISGIASYLKKIRKKPVEIIAIEPVKSPAITCSLNSKTFTAKPHTIQGIGAGFIPKTLNLSLIDDVVTVSDEDALNYTKDLIKKEGIFAGISSGAALNGALKYLKKNNIKSKNAVIILPDTGERYLSTPKFL
ncbi:MAG: cysteine synthase A [Deferribacterota bacterium]|nr:cysteine synthase A [Deferribacterota bacterium]